jgi:hypothetical protein
MLAFRFPHSTPGTGRRCALEQPDAWMSCVPMLLLATARRVLFRSFRCKADGMHLMVMRQMRLIRRRQNVFRLPKLGGFAVVPCCVLMMFSRKLVKFA